MALFDLVKVLLQCQHQAACFSFRVFENWNSDSTHFNSSFSANLWLRILMDDEISFHLFCHSLDSLSFTVEAVVEVDGSFAWVWPLGTRCGDCWLGWLRDGSDGAVLLLRLLLRVGYVEKAWNHRCMASLAWLFSPAWEAARKPSNSPRWRGGRHFHQALYLATLNHQLSYLSDNHDVWYYPW
jgi:hypothetical protein